MRISIIHPTARTGKFPGMPNGWLDSCWHWFYQTVMPADVEYIVVVHRSRLPELQAQLTGRGGFFALPGPAGASVGSVYGGGQLRPRLPGRSG